MNKSKASFFNAHNLTLLAILIALVVVMQTFGATINIGPVQLNFTLIPIALGAIMLGKWSGAFLGFACGVVVLVQVIIAPAGFYFIIWSMSPVITTLICLIKTTVAGFVAGVLFNIIEKKNKYAAVFVASGIIPVINTALFVIGCLFMNEAITTFQTQLSTLAEFGHVLGMNVFVFILVILVTFNFFFEFAINLLVAPALNRVLVAINKSGFKSKNKNQEVESDTKVETDIVETEDKKETENKNVTSD